MPDEQKTIPPQTELESEHQNVPEEFTRFSKLQIYEHWLCLIFFTLLVVTGLPQRFSESALAIWIVNLLGGIDFARGLHRISGIIFSLLAVWHIGRVSLGVLMRKIQPSMIPTMKDFKDAIGALKFYLGLSQIYPRFDRYDFRQKFEYFGVLMGGMVMIVTGFLLYYPIFFTKFLPGVAIPAAKVAHSYESMLAFLVIVIWHMYGSVFSPEVFPLDKSIFTGKISRERMEKEHPIELEKIMLKTRGLPAESKDSEQKNSIPD
jgi:cytochrome b subunit of formate dehydrogenase